MYQICVSGAAAGKSVAESKDEAVALGEAIAKSGNVLLTGATVGLPNYAAYGCKKAGGMSIGISPAATKLEHVKKYRLPTENYDFILYTGLNYSGRDSLLVHSSDAVLSLGGRLGTLHEFTVAMESDTPIGFLNNTGGVTDIIDYIVTTAGKQYYQDVIYSDEPEDLLKQVLKELDKRHAGHLDLYIGGTKAKAVDPDKAGDKERKRG